MAKSQAMWAISQSPAFRELLKRQVPELEQEVQDQLQSMSPKASTDTSDDNANMSLGQPSRAPSSLEDIDQGFIKGLEGTKKDGYVPNNKGKVIGNSGVTIATGLDLGQRSDLNDIDISDELKAKLQPYLGVEKEAALALINSNPLKLSQEEVESLDLAAEKAYYIAASKRFDSRSSGKKFDELPPQVQTALYSLYFNTGSIGPKTIEAASNDEDYSDLVSELKSYYPENSKMSKNYAGKRRVKEAEYIENNLEQPEEAAQELEVTSPEEVEELDVSIDRINQQQSSGDNTPVDQLEELLGKIDQLRVAQSDKDMLENEAVAMTSFADGQRLKEMIRKIQG